MISRLPARDCQQLARALHAALNPSPSAAEQRVRDLLPLAEMLDQQAQQEQIAPATGQGRASWRPTPAHVLGSLAVESFPVVAQIDYDHRRPADAPSGLTLSRRFGTWILACRAVWGLQADGRYSGLSHPWTTGTRGKKAPPRYAKHDALRAIRECALAYGRRPTSNVYIAWSAQRRAHARASGAPPPRLPAYKFIHSKFGGWPPALAAAAISDLDLAQARTDRGEPGPAVPKEQTPAGRLRAADLQALATAGIRPTDASALLKRGFGGLELGRAIHVARLLGGSLAWLAGLDTKLGKCPDLGLRLDAAAVRRLRRERRIPEQAIRDQIGLTKNEWRRLLDCRDEPQLAELIQLGGVLGVSPDALLTRQA